MSAAEADDGGDVIDAYNARFHRGWQSEIAAALQITPAQVSRMRGPTRRLIETMGEWLDATPPEDWPDRFQGLRRLTRNKE